MLTPRTQRTTFFAILALAAACSASGASGESGRPIDAEEDAGVILGPDGEVIGSIVDDDGSAPKKDSATTTKTCTPSPLAYDIPANNCDDDGNGKIDDVVACDTALASADAKNFAKSLGVCGAGTTTTWGTTAARYVNGYNASTTPALEQISILSKFGSVVVPREGASLGVLSTGYAQEYNAPSSLQSTKLAFKSGTGIKIVPGNLPPGYPKSVSGCPTNPEYADLAGVHLEIKAPSNAIGVTFDFDFFSSEWPDYVCSNYNDAFVAWVVTSKFTGNAALDKSGNPISVNGTYFDQCTKGAETGCHGAKSGIAACPSGDGELAGTGFANPGIFCGVGPQKSSGGGATGWLSSKVPITPGETIKIELLIWDTGDYRLDSSVLVDHLSWVPADATPFTVPKTGRPTEIL